MAAKTTMTKFLIVDDHAGVRTLIRQLAVGAHDTVRECATGEEAVRLAREFMPDIVTMDLRLPGVGGLEATRDICALQASVRVIVVTACDQPELRHAAHRAGATGYVVKDNLGELRSVLAETNPDATSCGVDARQSAESGRKG